MATIASTPPKVATKSSINTNLVAGFARLILAIANGTVFKPAWSIPTSCAISCAAFINTIPSNTTPIANTPMLIQKPSADVGFII